MERLPSRYLFIETCCNHCWIPEVHVVCTWPLFTPSTSFLGDGSFWAYGWRHMQTFYASGFGLCLYRLTSKRYLSPRCPYSQVTKRGGCCSIVEIGSSRVQLSNALGIASPPTGRMNYITISEYEYARRLTLSLRYRHLQRVQEHQL